MHTDEPRRRFFVAKDGCMAYYNEKDAKPFLLAGGFDVHPKVSSQLLRAVQLFS